MIVKYIKLFYTFGTVNALVAAKHTQWQYKV
jgi:hypothetical protein